MFLLRYTEEYIWFNIYLFGKNNPEEQNEKMHNSLYQVILKESGRQNSV